MRTEQARIQSAKKMRSFYEPAYFGEGSPDKRNHFLQNARYGDAYANILSNTPGQMGGFRILPSKSPEPLPRLSPTTIAVSGLGPQAPTGGFGDSYANMRAAYDAPPIGSENLSRYGVGQLKNYGVGALDAYTPMAREQNLRWR